MKRFEMTEKVNPVASKKKKKKLQRNYVFVLASPQHTVQEILVFFRLCISNVFTEEWVYVPALAVREGNIQIVGRPVVT